MVDEARFPVLEYERGALRISNMSGKWASEKNCNAR
jgi:hypothetical protein